ncbi:MAG: glutaredoxin family protein [Gammaproteobacteria bacterium]
MLELTLLARRDCHLCEALEAELLDWLDGRPRVQLRIVDVDRDPALRRRHGLRIPVLLHHEQEVCAGRFDARAAEALLGAW